MHFSWWIQLCWHFQQFRWHFEPVICTRLYRLVKCNKLIIASQDINVDINQVLHILMIKFIIPFTYPKYLAPYYLFIESDILATFRIPFPPIYSSCLTTTSIQPRHQCTMYTTNQHITYYRQSMKLQLLVKESDLAKRSVHLAGIRIILDTSFSRGLNAWFIWHDRRLAVYRAYSLHSSLPSIVLWWFQSDELELAWSG